MTFLFIFLTGKFYFSDENKKNYYRSFNNINEAGYAPVYAYDYEDELNEAKRKIKLIDSSLASAAKQLLREVMTR